MSVLDRKISEVVDENYIYGRALHYLGVDFYNYEDTTLRSLCQQKGISKSRLVRSFYQFDSKSRIPLHEIQSYPLKLTLEYLRYSHHSYIKDHLPYIAKLVNELPERCEGVMDLKAVFPLFVEDFINHIYEEEDDLFVYISELISVTNSNHHHKLHLNKKDICLKSLMGDHMDEDEMEGIRNLLSSIDTPDTLSKVVVSEIHAFDREILYHAQIENEILFPKAIELEDSIREKSRELSKLN